jgi:hypothetical protein
LSALCLSELASAEPQRAANDFDQHPRRRHPRLARRSAGGVDRVHPGVPDRVHLVVRADVSEPDLDLQQLRFRAARLGQQCVDLGEDRPSVVTGALRSFRGLPAKIDGVAVDDYLFSSAARHDGERFACKLLLTTWSVFSA